MEVRSRNSTVEDRHYDFEIDLNASNNVRSPSPSKEGRRNREPGGSEDHNAGKSCGKVVRREIGEMKKVTCQMLKGEGSYLR